MSYVVVPEPKKKGGGCLQGFFIMIGLTVLAGVLVNLFGDDDKPAQPAAPAQQLAQAATATPTEQEAEVVAPTETPERATRRAALALTAAAPTETPLPPTSTPCPDCAPPFDAVCTKPSNLTDVQMEAHIKSFVGQRVAEWYGWIWDVETSGGRYKAIIAMKPKGFLWTRDIELINIDADQAARLSVEQPVTFSGRIQQVRMAFGAICNPLVIEDVVIVE